MTIQTTTLKTSPIIDRIRRFNRKAAIGGTIIVLFVLMAVFAPVLAPKDPQAFVALPNQAPSQDHWLGTTGHGQDVFAQIVWGSRRSLVVGGVVGLLVTIIGTSIGMISAYFGGVVDNVLTLVTNIFLIVPGLPLLIVLVAFLPAGLLSSIIVLALTGWAGTARVMRAQTLSLREKDFVSSSIVRGESRWRIIFVEILPNMASIVGGALIGATIYGINAQAGLEFLGLGDIGVVSWGTILYWAGNNAGLLLGAWWTFVPAGACIALVAFALALVNYALDEITNPRLSTEKEINYVLKKHSLRNQRATPVIRRH